MKTVVFLFSAILFCTSNLFCQNNLFSESKNATFCGKTGDAESKASLYNVEELESCEFKIIALDSNLTVIEFQMSLVAKDNLYPYSEEKIKGNEIPKEFRTRILTQTQNIFLEHIQAINKKGERVNIKPIGIRIQ